METLDRVLESNADTDDLATMLMMVYFLVFLFFLLTDDMHSFIFHNRQSSISDNMEILTV